MKCLTRFGRNRPVISCAFAITSVVRKICRAPVKFVLARPHGFLRPYCPTRLVRSGVITNECRGSRVSETAHGS